MQGKDDIPCSLSPVPCTYFTPEDTVILNRFISEMEPKKALPADSLLIETASFFLGTPYVAATLEREPEGLVVNLREMDCATFVDNVVALSLMLKGGDISFDGFCRQLLHLRYRNDTITGYADRLHYTGDWVYENARKGILRDVTEEAGGVPLAMDLDFMSTHPAAYKQLKADTALVGKIAAIEKDINSRAYYYIPKARIDSSASRIRNGDVVCFTTSIKGLDTSHVGIIRRVGEKLTFIHASTKAGKVIVNEEPLKDYLLRGKSSTGIMLARLSVE